MNKKRVILAISIIILTALVVFFIGKKVKANSYVTEPVEKRTIVQIVEASGTINPVNTVSIGSTVSGLMMEIFVDFNSAVKKGQLLARMDTSTLQADVDKALGDLNNAKASYQEQLAITNNDRKTYIRYKNLVAKNFMAKSELDLAESTYFADQARLKAISAQISQAQASYDRAKYLLGFADIKTPVDGIVVSRKVDVGQPVAASFQAPELFLVAQDLKEMQIEVSVSEADIGKVKEGQEVEYTLDGYPDMVFKGKVSQVRISPTTVSNVVTYTVVVKVDNDDLKLKPGMTANVSIITQKKENVLCVPNMALKFTPQDNGQKYNKQGIWILANGKPERINIKLGASDDSYTEIISDEVQKGDRVIIEKRTKNSKSSSNQKRPMRMF